MSESVGIRRLEYLTQGAVEYLSPVGAQSRLVPCTESERKSVRSHFHSGTVAHIGARDREWKSRLESRSNSERPVSRVIYLGALYAQTIHSG